MPLYNGPPKSLAISDFGRNFSLSVIELSVQGELVISSLYGLFTYSGGTPIAGDFSIAGDFCYESSNPPL